MYILFCVNKTKSCAKCFEKREQFVLPFIYAGKFQSAYEGKYLSYWTLNEAGTDADEKIFLLRSDKNEIAEGNTGLDKAYAIRCIRK